MVSEQLLGRSPKDVSKKALGYDIESTDKHGNIMYFSVKVVEALGNAFVLSEKEYACSERLSTSYGVYVIENGNPENNVLIEDVTCIPFEKRVREWEWVSGKYDVVKRTQPDQDLTIDSTFVQEFSLKYLNRVQVALLKAICGGDIESFEAEYSCKATMVATQINSITDFYIGDSIIDSNMHIKDRYFGAVRYLLKHEK